VGEIITQAVQLSAISYRLSALRLPMLTALPVGFLGVLVIPTLSVLVIPNEVRDLQPLRDANPTMVRAS